MSRIVLFTDFGPSGPYTGQMEAVLQQIAPDVPVINLLSNAPIAAPRLSAYLLAALRYHFPSDSIFLCVVDPGVGGERRAVVVEAGGQRFVGPDNGLFNCVARQADNAQWFEIIWRPEACSMSFHGRDLFAPVAAKLAIDAADNLLRPFERNDLSDCPEDLAEIIYFDHYGNAMTGLRYRDEYSCRRLMVNGNVLEQAGTFSAVEARQAFWYNNSCGLVEIAVNQGRAEQQLGLKLGMSVRWAAA